MRKTELLLKRLETIGKVVEQKGEALCLLGLGSVGIETDRLDEYSDLDFFLIVMPGSKDRFINDLDWLEDTYPLAYSFKNTDDGYKVMFKDGIYGEFAVFEEHELENLSYSEGRIVWKAPAYENESIVKPLKSLPVLKSQSLDYVINEALTNLYVGLGRYARGEKLSATRFVEGYAVDGLISVMHLLEQEIDCYPDRFSNERRLEQRYPVFATKIAGMIQGYDKVPESAIQLLNYLERIYPVNETLSAEIRILAKQLT